jgi:hypothetical protein
LALIVGIGFIGYVLETPIKSEMSRAKLRPHEKTNGLQEPQTHGT